MEEMPLSKLDVATMLRVLDLLELKGELRDFGRRLKAACSEANLQAFAVEMGLF